MSGGWKAFGLSIPTKNALALAMRLGGRVDLLSGWQIKRLAAAGYITNYRINDAGREAWERLSRGEKVTP